MTVDLEALTANLFAKCDAYLGDTITITPPGGSAITVKAGASFADSIGDFGNTTAIIQNMLVDCDKAALPGKPGPGWRVATAALPGKAFEPINVMNDDSGRRWVFALQECNG